MVVAAYADAQGEDRRGHSKDGDQKGNKDKLMLSTTKNVRSLTIMQTAQRGGARESAGENVEDTLGRSSQISKTGIEAGDQGKASLGYEAR